MRRPSSCRRHSSRYSGAAPVPRGIASDDLDLQDRDQRGPATVAGRGEGQTFVELDDLEARRLSGSRFHGALARGESARSAREPRAPGAPGGGDRRAAAEASRRVRARRHRRDCSLKDAAASAGVTPRGLEDRSSPRAALPAQPPGGLSGGTHECPLEPLQGCPPSRICAEARQAGGSPFCKRGRETSRVVRGLPGAGRIAARHARALLVSGAGGSSRRTWRRSCGRRWASAAIRIVRAAPDRP